MAYKKRWVPISTEEEIEPKMKQECKYNFIDPIHRRYVASPSEYD